MQNPPYDWNPESKFVQTGRTESGRRNPESKTDLDNLTLNWYLFLHFFFFQIDFFTVLKQCRDMTNNLRLNPKARVCSPSLSMQPRKLIDTD